MTLREKLADWISGGALTRARLSAAFDKAHHEEMIRIYRGAARDANIDFTAMSGFAKKLKSALNRIAAMETPKANATVKRMAKIAREAEK